MAYKVIILYQLYMPSYFLGTFTEYPFLYPALMYPETRSIRLILPDEVMLPQLKLLIS